MAETPYTKWYNEGTAAFTKGSTTVTGTSTYWTSAGIKAGDILIDSDGKLHEITSVDSATSITLGKTYTGTTGSGKSYSIIRTFNSTMNASIAAQLATLLNEFEQRYDLDMQTITGKSAYDIAKANGYAGTQAQWLESLKAAGEWSSASSRLTTLESAKTSHDTSIATLTNRSRGFEVDSANAHNSIYRGKNLGTQITDAQWEAVSAGTFEDLYIGDYWTINGYQYIIAAFNWCDIGGNFMILWQFTSATAVANGTDHPSSFSPLADGTAVTISTGIAGSHWYETLVANDEVLEQNFGDHLIRNSSVLFSTSTAVSNGRITGVKNESDGIARCLPTCANFGIYGNGIVMPEYPGDGRTNVTRLVKLPLAQYRGFWTWQQTCAYDSFHTSNSLVGGWDRTLVWVDLNAGLSVRPLVGVH